MKENFTLIYDIKPISPLCSVTSVTTACYKSKSGGLYHLAMSCFSAHSATDLIHHLYCLIIRNLNLISFY